MYSLPGKSWVGIYARHVSKLNRPDLQDTTLTDLLELQMIGIGEILY